MGLIFTYVMTYGGAAAGVVSPFIGLLIYIGFAILKPDDLWYWSVPQGGNYSRTVAIGLLAGWTLNGFGRWKLGRGAAGITLAFVLYWGWTVLGYLPSSNKQDAWVYIDFLTKILLPFLVGITTIDSLAKLKAVTWVIVLCHGYVALEMNRAYYSGFNRFQELGHGGMDNNCAAIAMVTATGLAVFLGMHAPRWWQKGLALAAALLMIHCVLFAFSRGGMLGLCVMGGVAFLIIPKRPIHFVGLCVVVALALFLAGREVRQRFFTTFAEENQRDSSAQSRLDMWTICFKAMLAHPILGLGPRQFPVHAHEFGLTPRKEAHTLWLQVAAEQGIPGLVFLVMFYFLCLRHLWPLTREGTWADDPWYHYIARMVIASLVGFMVSAQFVSLVGLELPYYVVLIGAGALKLQAQDMANPAFTLDDLDDPNLSLGETLQDSVPQWLYEN